MSDMNVLPSAPPPSPENSIYPKLEQHTQTPISVSSHDFRLTKINEIAAELAHEVQHYRIVPKKYKLVKQICNWFAGDCGVLSAVASSASLGTAISIVGLPATVPLASVSGCLALVSSGLIVCGKKNWISSSKNTTSS